MAIVRTTGRARARLLLVVGAAAVLAACSSSGAAAELTSSPAVTANGQHYAYASGSVAKSDWPRVCTLLSADSAAAAIGNGVSIKTFHERCYYIPGSVTFPTLTVTILGIGSDQSSGYDAVRDARRSARPAAVAGVGRAAVFYRVAGSATANLDLLADQGLFELSLRYPADQRSSLRQARSILIKVGRVLAAEFES